MPNLVDAEVLDCAMRNGIGPLCAEFETFELKRIHDLWIEGFKMVAEARERMDKVLDARAFQGCCED